MSTSLSQSAADYELSLRESAEVAGCGYAKMYQAVRRGIVPARQTWDWSWRVRAIDALAFRTVIAQEQRDKERAEAIRVAEERARAEDRARKRDERKKHEEEVRVARERDKARVRLERLRGEQKRRRDAVALTQDATHYACADIAASEDRRGRQILERLTKYPGYDPAAVVRACDVADMPTFIEGLDRWAS